jgi:hypothetical protein
MRIAVIGSVLRAQVERAAADWIAARTRYWHSLGTGDAVQAFLQFFASLSRCCSSTISQVGSGLQLVPGIQFLLQRDGIDMCAGLSHLIRQFRIWFATCVQCADLAAAGADGMVDVGGGGVGFGAIDTQPVSHPTTGIVAISTWAILGITNSS